MAFQRIYAKYPAFAEEHKGVKVLAAFTHGPGIVFNTKRPIAKVEDLSGLKFRVGGGMVNEIAKALGMNVTLKPAPESYELLSTGVMDGTLFPAESAESFKIEKIIRHATTFPGGLYNTSFVFVMNQAKYDSLPADVKKAIDEMSGEFAVAHGRARPGTRPTAAASRLCRPTACSSRKADAAFVKAVKSKTGALEDSWVKAAEGTRPEGREEGAGRVPRRDRQAREVTLDERGSGRARACDQALRRLLEWLCGSLAAVALFAIMMLTLVDVERPQGAQRSRCPGRSS